jgi:hypothetical protein
MCGVEIEGRMANRFFASPQEKTVKLCGEDVRFAMRSDAQGWGLRSELICAIDDRTLSE